MAKEKVVHRKTVERYQLEKYTGRKSRHQCPSCNAKYSFARFVDVTTGEELGEDIGRCNREGKCGYIKSPKDNKGLDLKVPLSEVKKEYTEKEFTSLIDSKYILQSMQSEENNFLYFLNKHFDKSKVDYVTNLYKIGTDNHWENSTVFWQIDEHWDVRTGKIMLYNINDLKRVKTPYNHINWVHTPRKNHDYGINMDYALTQCFFGEHLLNYEKFTKFAVVESEKTAILGTLMQPEIGWIATGGLQNISEKRLLPFKDKELVFYPDKGSAFDKWVKKVKPFINDYKITVSDSVEKMENLKEGDDIGDYILSKYTKI